MNLITKANFEAEVEKSETLVVLDLYADWCGPCRLLSPVLEEIAEEHPDVKFAKVNVDSDPEIAAMFHVESIPFVALVKNNTFLDFSVGYVPKSTIVNLVEKYK